MTAQLERLNPVPTAMEEAYVDRGRKERDLEDILRTSPTVEHAPVVPIRQQRLRFAARAAIAAAVAIGVGFVTLSGHPLVTGWGTSTAMAATPRVLDGFLDEGSLDLTFINDIADSALSSGQSSKLGSSYQSWSLFTRVDGHEPVRSAVVPQDVKYAVNPDRSGSLVVTIGRSMDGEPVADGLPPVGTVIRHEQYGAGQASLMYPGTLSSDRDTLLTQLSQGHSIAELGTGELFVAVADLYKSRRPGPEVRAAMLRLIASQPDVRNLGNVRDRAGRAGLALGVTSSQPGGLPSRFVIVIDRDSGDLLSYEQILTSIPGKLNIAIPAVVEYDLFN